ncbi:MAG TPA: hypothetical protein VKY42_12260 [Trueperaceae bacterium]|nr:hypothetical protein [Trueperaceae bacterium]
MVHVVAAPPDPGVFAAIAVDAPTCAAGALPPGVDYVIEPLAPGTFTAGVPAG